MTLTHVSDCHHAGLILTRTSEKGGVFHCEECKQKCKAMEAMSHCCHKPVMVSPEGFPFICTECEGDCELGNPSTPTYEDEINARILKIMQLYKSGDIPEENAWKRITKILDGERVHEHRTVANGILDEMRKVLSMPKTYDPTSQVFKQGIDASLHELEKIVRGITPK